MSSCTGSRQCNRWLLHISFHDDCHTNLELSERGQRSQTAFQACHGQRLGAFLQHFIGLFTFALYNLIMNDSHPVHVGRRRRMLCLLLTAIHLIFCKLANLLVGPIFDFRTCRVRGYVPDGSIKLNVVRPIANQVKQLDTDCPFPRHHSVDCTGHYTPTPILYTLQSSRYAQLRCFHLLIRLTQTSPPRSYACNGCTRTNPLD